MGEAVRKCREDVYLCIRMEQKDTVRKTAAQKQAVQGQATRETGAHPSAMKPVVKKPAVKPAAKRPAVEPAVEKPVVEPAAKRPAAKKPVAKRPVAKRPVAKKRSSGRGKGRKRKVAPAAAIAAAALILALAVGLPLLRHARQPGEGGAALPPAAFSALGIDISHNNAGPIVWDSLRVMVDRSGRTVRDLEQARKVYPVKFVFIKATEGLTMRDPEFRSNWSEAGKRDIQRGAYHFFRTSKDGAAQARHFIKTVGPLRHGDLPPVLDLETIHRGCTYKLLNERALQWLQTVEKHYGRKPIVYTSDSFARDIIDRKIKDNYPIWIAHYGVDAPIHEDWTYWQFTDRAYIYGMPEPVDLSIRK